MHPGHAQIATSASDMVRTNCEGSWRLPVATNASSSRMECEYGLGSRCHAEPRVGEGMRSDHKDRNELVKIEDRSNECAHPIPVNHQETIE